MTDPGLSLSGEDAHEMRRVDGLAQSGAAGVPELIDRLSHPSWAVRRAVVGALARVGAAAVAPLCEILRAHRAGEARLAAAVDALSASIADVDDAVLALAQSGLPAAVICDAAQILGRRRSLAAVPALERLTVHADDNVALAAIEALGRIGGGAGAGALLVLVAARGFFRTFPALDVLGHSGDSRAVPALLPLLGEPLFALEAVRALGHTGDAETVVPLLDRLLAAEAAEAREIAVALTRIQRFQQERFGAASRVEEPIANADRQERLARRLIAALDGAEPAEQAAIASLLGLSAGAASVPALLSLLAGADPVAAAATASLRRLGRAIEPQLLARLGAADSLDRLRLLPLVAARSQRAGEVVACLSDPNPAVRVAACEALGRTGTTSAVGALFERLHDPDRRVEQAAVSALQSLGGSETEALALAAARSPDPRLRRTAVRIIAYFGYPSGIDPLLEAAGDADEKLREAALAGLAFLDDPRAAEAVLAATTHASAKTRAAAIRALGNRAPDARGEAPLLAALSDPDPWVRYYACQSMGKLRRDGYAEAVVRLIDDPAGQVRVAVIDALSQLRSPEALMALERAAGADDPDVRRAALIGLGVVRRPGSLPLLLAALSAPDAATRLVAIAAIAAYDTKEVVPALARGALDEDASVASASIGFLGQRAGSEASDALIGLLLSPTLREQVVAALANPIEGRLGTVLSALESRGDALAPWLVAALARMARADADAALAAALKAPTAVARRAAAAALAARRSPDSRQALEAAANHDADEEVRRIAVFALAAQST